jgi:hypothetical protein
LILLSTSISMHTLLLSLLLLLWQHVAGLGLRAACIPQSACTGPGTARALTTTRITWLM